MTTTLIYVHKSGIKYLHIYVTVINVAKRLEGG